MSYNLRDLPTFVQENMDAQVTVKVPATPTRKAYEYTRNTNGGGSQSLASKAKDGLKAFSKRKVGNIEKAAVLGLSAIGVGAGVKGMADERDAKKKWDQETEEIRAKEEKSEQEREKAESEQKSRALELNRRKRSTRRNSLDERIDSFIVDLKSKV